MDYHDVPNPYKRLCLSELRNALLTGNPFFRQPFCGMWAVEGKSRFLRHVRPYWDVIRHRIAPAATTTLDQIRMAGQFQVYAGHVCSYEEGKDDVAVILALRHTRKELVVRAGLVVNCTGLSVSVPILSLITYIRKAEVANCVFFSQRLAE